LVYVGVNTSSMRLIYCKSSNRNFYYCVALDPFKQLITITVG